MKWNSKNVLVTGGVGFIGHHLVLELLKRGSIVTVVDHPKRATPQIWKKKIDHYLREAELMGLKPEYDGESGYVCGDSILFQPIDIEKEPEKLLQSMQKREIDVVFHLAAVFGGRGFVDEKQAECFRSIGINHNLFSSAVEVGVKHVHFSSSACVYPPSLNKPGYLLNEDDILSTGEGWAQSDNVYGWVKLMGELELQTFHKRYGIKGSIARYLTVYGPREFDDSHAIASLTTRALKREDPFVVWGTGEQERGFTYVDDIVAGTILCSEKIRDGTPINLGWDKRYKIREVVRMILEITNHSPAKLIFDPTKPEGPQSRALDISRARKLLDWQPKVDLYDGLTRTLNWKSEILYQGLGSSRKEGV